MLKKALRAIFGNFRLKAWALLIALGIWFYANSRLTEEELARASVDISPPPGHELLFQSQKSAQVVIAGPRALLSRVRSELNQNYLRLSYNLTEQDLDEGWAALRIRPEWLQPGLLERDFVQLKFREITPEHTRVFASPIIERTLPVNIRTLGRPAPGYRLAPEAEATPSEVTVRGPAVAVAAMGFVATEEVPVYG
ncbi:MAG: CdaR family protein, partial [Planctomycetota bacterium]